MSEQPAVAFGPLRTARTGILDDRCCVAAASGRSVCLNTARVRCDRGERGAGRP